MLYEKGVFLMGIPMASTILVQIVITPDKTSLYSIEIKDDLKLLLKSEKKLLIKTTTTKNYNIFNDKLKIADVDSTQAEDLDVLTISIVKENFTKFVNVFAVGQDVELLLISLLSDQFQNIFILKRNFGKVGKKL